MLPREHGGAMERPGGHAETGCTSLTSDSGIGRPSWFGCCPAVRDATTRGRRGALSCCTGKLLLGPRIVAGVAACSSRRHASLFQPLVFGVGASRGAVSSVPESLSSVERAGGETRDEEARATIHLAEGTASSSASMLRIHLRSCTCRGTGG